MMGLFPPVSKPTKKEFGRFVREQRSGHLESENDGLSGNHKRWKGDIPVARLRTELERGKRAG